jgi:cobalt/nickel transport system permease protein
MHLPNGLLDPKISTGLGFASAGALAYCFAKVKALVTSPALQEAFAAASNITSTISGKARRTLSSYGQNLIAKMAAVAFFIFVAQLFDFTIMPGVTGHLFGGVLAAVILGPWAGAIVLTTVLTTQAALLGDGGIFALGANIFNMALIGAIGGYYVFYVISRAIKGRVGFYAGAAVAAWLSIFVGAAALSVELWLSGAFDLAEILHSMLSSHAIIGISEAMITIAVLGLLSAFIPNIIRTRR